MSTLQNPSPFDHLLEDIRQDRDIYQELIKNQKSDQTQRAYASDVRDFFNFLGTDPTPHTVKHFLQLKLVDATALALKWKLHLKDKGLAFTTINRKLYSLRAMVRYAHDVGCCDWLLNATSLKLEKSVKTYRDTTGVSPDWINKMIASIDRETLIGKRDYAILQLLWSNALRRSELVSINISDWDGDRYLWIQGKGRSVKERITLNSQTVEALRAWLYDRQRFLSEDNEAMFISFGKVNKHKRLSAQHIYLLVDTAAQTVGLPKKFSPHRIRHSAITAALDATGGDIRAVQKLSRHSKLEVLLIYDDCRLDKQGDISDLLGGMV